MFKSSVGLVTLAFLSQDVMAAQQKFRPIPGTNPWHKDKAEEKYLKPDWPVDYKVPNFGVDKDILTTQKNIKASETKIGKKFTASFEKPKGHPVDYFVPNFGPDYDIALTKDNIAQTEADLKHVWTPNLTKVKPPPRNYKVPNFGMDQDIKDTQSNLAKTEKKMKKKWVLTDKKQKKKSPPKDYKVPNFGVDKDILDTQANIAKAEAKLGKWNVKQDADGNWIVPTAISKDAYTYKKAQTSAPDADQQVQLDEQSDPICPSSGCDTKKKKAAYPTDYFVPNFGRDHEMNANDGSLAWAEKQHKHKWVVDPESLKKKPAEDLRRVDYGVDQDILDAQKSIASIEKIHGAWNPVQDDNGYWIVPEAFNNKSYNYKAVQLESSEESESDEDVQLDREPLLTWKPKARKNAYPKDYKVPNFGQDPDIIATQKSLATAEKRLKRKWKVDPNFKKAKGHPVDYKVPNFGQDQDIKDTLSIVKKMEQKYGAWNPVQDDNGVWIVPTAADNKSYRYKAAQMVQLDTESDPICNSAGCPEPKKKKSHPVDYFVPNFGKDHEIAANDGSLAWAEKYLKHHWIPAEKPKPEDPIMYAGKDTPLDGDMVASLKHLEQMEKKHGAWNLPPQDD